LGTSTNPAARTVFNRRTHRPRIAWPSCQGLSRRATTRMETC
jgi:hypothetical protein